MSEPAEVTSHCTKRVTSATSGNHSGCTAGSLLTITTHPHPHITDTCGQVVEMQIFLIGFWFSGVPSHSSGQEKDSVHRAEGLWVRDLDGVLSYSAGAGTPFVHGLNRWHRPRRAILTRIGSSAFPREGPQGSLGTGRDGTGTSSAQNMAFHGRDTSQWLPTAQPDLLEKTDPPEWLAGSNLGRQIRCPVPRSYLSPVGSPWGISTSCGGGWSA